MNTRKDPIPFTTMLSFISLIVFHFVFSFQAEFTFRQHSSVSAELAELDAHVLVEAQAARKNDSAETKESMDVVLPGPTDSQRPVIEGNQTATVIPSVTDALSFRSPHIGSLSPPAHS